MFVDMFHPAVGLTAWRGVWMGFRDFQAELKRCGDNVGLGPQFSVPSPSLCTPVYRTEDGTCGPSRSFTSPHSTLRSHAPPPSPGSLHSSCLSPHQGAVWNCCCSCCWLGSYPWVVAVLETVCATPHP